MSMSQFKFAALAAGASLIIAASAQAVEISLSEATGDPGQTVDISASLSTEGSEVAGTQNDITFGSDSGIAIAAKTNGRPDCAVNPDIEKGGTSFAFQPSGCTAGTDCTGVRALVLALDNVDPIPDGSVLYTCKVAIASSASAGEKTLSNTNAGSSDPDGGALTTTGTDGRVIVAGGASDATIIIGSATGEAGDTVSFDVTLETGTDVAGTQNDIAFAAPIAIAAKTNGRPDCTVNPDIEKGGTSFAFQPSGCTVGETCTGVRALVLALDNVDPIPTDSVLYSCNVNIAEGAADGDYPLTCSNPGASDPDGGALLAECTNGKITVGGGPVTDTPTATPTETPTTPAGENTPTATNTAPPTNTATATRTNTISGGGGFDDDGCAVVAPAQTGNGWLLILPAAALLWLRRRSK
jgi:MYXO-CTERM domain-containing protein